MIYCPKCGTLTKLVNEAGIANLSCPSCSVVWENFLEAMANDDLWPGIISSEKHEIICPKCGYERYSSDSTISRSKCPSCRASYIESVTPPPAEAKYTDTKACEFCGEQILGVAKKCKHCKSMLDETISSAENLIANPIPNAVNFHTVSSLGSRKDRISYSVATILFFLFAALMFAFLLLSVMDLFFHDQPLWTTTAITFVCFVCAALSRLWQKKSEKGAANSNILKVMEFGAPLLDVGMPETKSAQNKGSLSGSIVGLIIFGSTIWYFWGGGLHRQVSSDFTKQYEITKGSGSKVDICVRAGLVAESYLQANNQADYHKWKAIQAKDCNSAGVLQ